MEYYDQRKIILPVLMAGDLALASYHDLKGKMIMQVNMKKGNGKNSITSKQFNRGLIFQLIATGTCNTRIELSRRTGLAKTTVTNIVAEFMEKGIVKECEEELTEVCGRNPIILKVADQAPKIIGILVFRTNIQAVLCSLDMQIFRTETIEFGELTGDILIQNAFELVDRMMEEEKNILGIGIASIGPVDIRNGIILNPPRFYGVKHVPIKEAIQKKYNLPVYFDHDNNCAALAEKLFGIGKAEQDFLLLAVSNGIGSGFVCGGEVFHSYRGFETELGHVSINCKGLQCSCGNRGCLEMYASSYVVREKLKKITGLNLPYADYFKIHDRPEVEDILEEMIQDISAGLVSIINMLQPEMIVLGYDGIDWPEDYVKKLEILINDRKIAQDGWNIPVKKAYFGKQAQLVGAAALVVNRKISGLNLIASVKDNISIAYMDMVTKGKFLIDFKKEKENADELIKKIKIKCSSRDTLAGTLSGGNQQKIVIAKWFMGNPDLLIMDEPTRGIDIGAKAEIYKLMDMLVKSGKSIIMISSETPELLGMSDRVIVMHEGYQTGEFRCGELDQDKLMAYAIGEGNKYHQ